MSDDQASTSLHEFLGETEGQSEEIEDSASDVGTRIADARVAAGRTQTEVANQLGVKVSTIAKWERGTASPRSNRLAALAGILGVSLSWLIVGYGNEPTSTDDLGDVRAPLSRVQTQLADALTDVEALVSRLDGIDAAS